METLAQRGRSSCLRPHSVDMNSSLVPSEPASEPSTLCCVFTWTSTREDTFFNVLQPTNTGLSYNLNWPKIKYPNSHCPKLCWSLEPSEHLGRFWGCPDSLPGGGWEASLGPEVTGEFKEERAVRHKEELFLHRGRSGSLKLFVIVRFPKELGSCTKV